MFQGFKDLGSLQLCFFFLSSCFFDSPFLIALGGASLFCFDLDMVISFVRGMWPHPFSSNNCLFSVFIIFKGFLLLLKFTIKKYFTWYLNYCLTLHDSWIKFWVFMRMLTIFLSTWYVPNKITHKHSMKMKFMFFKFFNELFTWFYHVYKFPLQWCTTYLNIILIVFF